MTSSVSEAARLADRIQRFFERIPHGLRLGLEVERVAPGSILAKLPYTAEIIGNPYTEHIHSGALTALIDQASGAAVMLALARREAIATLDLRVDHLRPAQAGVAVYAQADCYRMTEEVAFVRCVCYDVEPGDPVATSMSTFMRTGSKRVAQSAGGKESEA